MESKDKMIKCDCGHGVLLLEHDEDFGLMISHLERDPTRSISNRIKLAINCLKGKPYLDMVIINDDKISELIEFLKETTVNTVAK